MVEERVGRLETEVSELRERIARLEPRSVAAPERPAPRVTPPPVPPPRTEPPRTAPAPRPSFGRPSVDLPALEDLLGGRVLAWAGGAALVVGLAFLMALGMSQGWIGETARTLMGGTGAAALMVAGVWLHERRGRTDAALAAFSAGVAGMFAIVTVAAQVYDLIPTSAGIGLTVLTGALATTLAVRWESQGIAGLGILGAMLAPTLAGTWDGGSTLILGVAAVGAVTVLVSQGWRWLSVGVIAVAAPQWCAFLIDNESVPAVLVTTVGFGVIGAVAAIGHDLREKATQLVASSGLLLTFNALLVGWAGYGCLDAQAGHTSAVAWLWGVAAVHLAMGLEAARRTDLPKDLSLLTLSIGALAGNVAFAATVDGPGRAIGWAVAGLAFAALQGHRARRAGSHEDVLLSTGLGGHLALGLTQVLVADAPPTLLTHGGSLGATSALALLALTAACFASSRLSGAGHSELRHVLDGVGLVLVAYITALTFDGTLLVLAYATEAVVLAGLARRLRDELTGIGAMLNLGLAAVLAFVAMPPEALSVGVDRPLAVALGGGAAVASAALVAWINPFEDLRSTLVGFAGVAALYLASVLVVTPFQPGGGAAGATLLDLPVRQQGQVVLSALWGTVGLAGLVIGLTRDVRPLRLAALGLLLTTVGKVFLIDLATLTSVYRVISFIALGLLLLIGAFAWQRVRPRALGDLREVPQGVR